MKKHFLKEKLKNREVTIGSWITIGHQAIVEILAEAGFEWLVVDLEHTTIDLNMAQILISTIQSFDMAALVRVSKNEEVIIKRVLDAGANGVIVPMVNSKENAEQAVLYVKYPPRGRRGVGLNRAQKYGLGFEEYKKWLDENVIIIAQIEHIDGVNNIDEIISVPEIDGVIIGPYDLSASMGYPGEYDREEVKKALFNVERKCINKKKALGFHVIDPDHTRVKEKIDVGCSFIAFSTDFLFLGIKARDEMHEIYKVLYLSS